jgi:hypothetical protein
MFVCLIIKRETVKRFQILKSQLNVMKIKYPQRYTADQATGLKLAVFFVALKVF